MDIQRRIELLKEYGITKKDVVAKILGCDENIIEKKLQNDTCNGLFNKDDTFYLQKWIVNNPKHKSGYALKESCIVPFVLSNKRKYNIQEISKMVRFGKSKVPSIIMEKNLYDYVSEKKERSEIENRVSQEDANKRIALFYQYKNDKECSMTKVGEIVGSMNAVERFKRMLNPLFGK